METEKPTQRDVGIALDFLIDKILKEPNVENFSKAAHALQVFGNNYFGYNVDKYKEVYDELHGFFVTKTVDFCPYKKEEFARFQTPECIDCDGKGMYEHSGVKLFCVRYEKRGEI